MRVVPGGGERQSLAQRVKSPQTNAICERFHKIVLNEFYRIAYREKLYRDLAELQADWIAGLRNTIRCGPARDAGAPSKPRCTPSTACRWRSRSCLPRQPDQKARLTGHCLHAGEEYCQTKYKLPQMRNVAS